MLANIALAVKSTGPIDKGYFIESFVRFKFIIGQSGSDLCIVKESVAVTGETFRYERGILK